MNNELEDIKKDTIARMSASVNGNVVNSTLEGHPMAILTGLMGMITHFAQILDSDPAEVAFEIADSMKSNLKGVVTNE